MKEVLRLDHGVLTHFPAPAGWNKPALILCPGGGYEMTSDREAEPMAMQFLAMGYHVAILRYSVCPARYPAALLQVAESVLYLKEHADEYHIDPEKIVVQGCSAGGHLLSLIHISEPTRPY